MLTLLYLSNSCLSFFGNFLQFLLASLAQPYAFLPYLFNLFPSLKSLLLRSAGLQDLPYIRLQISPRIFLRVFGACRAFRTFQYFSFFKIFTVQIFKLFNLCSRLQFDTINYLWSQKRKECNIVDIKGPLQSSPPNINLEKLQFQPIFVSGFRICDPTLIPLKNLQILYFWAYLKMRTGYTFCNLSEKRLLDFDKLCRFNDIEDFLNFAKKHDLNYSKQRIRNHDHHLERGYKNCTSFCEQVFGQNFNKPLMTCSVSVASFSRNWTTQQANWAW